MNCYGYKKIAVTLCYLITAAPPFRLSGCRKHNILQ